MIAKHKSFLTIILWHFVQLVRGGGFDKLKPVDPPKLQALLQALRQPDADAWDDVFHWLYPKVREVAQHMLSPFLPQDVEDVAIEALEKLVPKVRTVKTVEEFKPLATAIAHNLAVGALRKHFAAKRGAGQTQSFESLKLTMDDSHEPAAAKSPLDELDQAELSDLIAQLLTDLNPEQRAILNDYYLGGLSYEQIASKHGLAIGTVGVYLKRGLEAIRCAIQRQPKLLKELEAFLR
jgi:RNA polymerase sigma factor (sigma-70 family)